MKLMYTQRVCMEMSEAHRFLAERWQYDIASNKSIPSSV